MDIHFDTPIRNLDGQPVLEGNVPLLAKDIVITACLTPLEGDRQQAGLGYRLYTLARRLHDGGVVDLTAEDAAFLLQRVEAIGYPPLTVGQMTDLLNGRGPLSPDKRAA